MFVFLFLFLFRQTKDKADQGDEYLAVFVQLELSDTSYFAELVERNRFLTDHIFEGVIRKEDISGVCSRSAICLRSCCREFEQCFIHGSGFDRTDRTVFVAAFLGRQGKIFDLLVNGHERLLLAEKDLRPNGVTFR